MVWEECKGADLKVGDCLMLGNQKLWVTRIVTFCGLLYLYLDSDEFPYVYSPETEFNRRVFLRE